MSHRRTRHPTHEEILLWRHVMREAQPLHPVPEMLGNEAGNDNVPPPMPPAKSAAKPVPAPTAGKIKAKLKELVSGQLPDMDKRTAERLTKGQMAVEGRLDLHGLTEAQAHAALNRFLAVSRSLGRRCVLVITGKGVEGKGVIRASLPKWLNGADLRPLVLGISQAKQRDGGEGAFYVLLKRNRVPEA
ncbi:MAG: Smr/MutS family protein [Rhodospirillales bacterium]|nr:Smr/MutS family protein [Rhodospirillales bacterium]